MQAVILDSTKGVIVLERAAETPNPAYCVHGHVQCIRCAQWCLLGSETLKAVQSGISPLCVVCAITHIKSPEAKVGRLHDHRKADGPHV